jgi:ribonuclease P protein component
MVKTMKKINRLLSNLDFQKLIKNSKSFSNKSYIVFYHKNQIEHIRIGISVSTKLGGAVARNKIKRQVRMMLNQTIDLNLKKDIVIIVKSGYAKNTYIKNKEELITLFKKINEVA